MAPARRDFTGQRFGRLVGVRYTGHDTHHATVWLWQCDCGNTVERAWRDVTSRVYGASCGCVKSTALTPRGRTARERLYGEFVRGANYRNLTVELTFDDWTNLTSTPCYYCGKGPESRTRRGTGTVGEYLGNGLDRLDSRLGYLKANVVPCCALCNRMKMAVPEVEFVSHVTTIYLTYLRRRTSMYRKEIVYDAESRDYAMYLDSELVGYARTYHEAEVTLDQLVFELMNHSYFREEQAP